MEEEQYYDLVFPPGTPRTIIREIINNFDVELVERGEQLSFANMDGDVRNLIAARGKKEVMIEVEKYFRKKLQEFIDEPDTQPGT
ncbi:MAG TPA: hypothetical protein PLG55_11070 [Methanospirillum sp.]|jgi:hypothetical protein|uniref:hypothetical protein n=1 Tax=Methanospirillum sp. TaxID=45200 RepID=UPI001BD4E4D3|nr:hypothetical protein [Methanospirillum sp.]HPY61250.1 hypothetical protein [Methanospirillum sp.]HQB99358.1 hypothetical protein [Methanospirillum sp.]